MYEHSYSLVFMKGNETMVDKTFTSREQATQFMYKLCGKYHLQITTVYDDKHAKTYICGNNATFYIDRM